MDLRLANGNCVVTNATGSIGFATTQSLLREGARVVMVESDPTRLEESFERLASENSDRRERLLALPLDVTEADASARIVSACGERFGPVNVLVINAGVSYGRDLEELADRDWEFQWNTSVMSPMRLMRDIVPRMAEQGWGRVVSVCVSEGTGPDETNAAYSVGSAAAVTLSRAFAERFKGTGVAINAIVPRASEASPDPSVLADWYAATYGNSRAEVETWNGRRSGLRPPAEPTEVAALVLWLCSTFAQSLNGTGGVIGITKD